MPTKKERIAETCDDWRRFEQFVRREAILQNLHQKEWSERAQQLNTKIKAKNKNPLDTKQTVPASIPEEINTLTYFSIQDRTQALPAGIEDASQR